MAVNPIDINSLYRYIKNSFEIKQGSPIIPNGRLDNIFKAISSLSNNLSLIQANRLNNLLLPNATGNDLDLIASVFNIIRQQESKGFGLIIVNGNSFTIEVGTSLFDSTNNKYYKTTSGATNTNWALINYEEVEASNLAPNISTLAFNPAIEGVTSILEPFFAPFTTGSVAENDNQLRNRIKANIKARIDYGSKDYYINKIKEYDSDYIPVIVDKNDISTIASGTAVAYITFYNGGDSNPSGIHPSGSIYGYLKSLAPAGIEVNVTEPSREELSITLSTDIAISDANVRSAITLEIKKFINYTGGYKTIIANDIYNYLKEKGYLTNNSGFIKINNNLDSVSIPYNKYAQFTTLTFNVF